VQKNRHTQINRVEKPYPSTAVDVGGNAELRELLGLEFGTSQSGD